MAPTPPWLAPDPVERGRVSADLPGLLADTIGAWDLLLDAVDGIDLAAIGRKNNRTVARTLVVLGSWPEGRPLARIRDDALIGRLDAEPLDDIEARIIDSHVDCDAVIMRDALIRARDDIADWAASPDVEHEALLPVGGPLGVVPMGTLVSATAFQCSIAALDLAPAGVDAPPLLLDLGLSALIDVVGAVAAAQSSSMTLLALTPDLAVGTGSLDGAWRTRQLDDEQSRVGPALMAASGTVLDIAAGRAFAPAAYARGDLRVREPVELLAIATMLAKAPGLPGTEGLRSTLAALSSSTIALRGLTASVGKLWRRNDPLP